MPNDGVISRRLLRQNKQEGTVAKPIRSISGGQHTQAVASPDDQILSRTSSIRDLRGKPSLLLEAILDALPSFEDHPVDRVCSHLSPTSRDRTQERHPLKKNIVFRAMLGRQILM